MLNDNEVSVISGGSKGGGLGGLNPPSEKKSSPYLGVSLCFGDILSGNRAQYALDCMRKPLESKNFPGRRPFDPLHLNIYFSNFPPPPLSEKLDLPLVIDTKWCSDKNPTNTRR